MKLLFICTGNTCRSPMAQGLARIYFPDDYEILSAGINANEGESISNHAAAVLKEKGLDMSGHRAVRLTEEMLEYADDIFTMTRSQANHLKNLYPQHCSKIKTLGSRAGQEINDPWGGSLEEYRRCARQIEELIREIILPA